MDIIYMDIYTHMEIMIYNNIHCFITLLLYFYYIITLLLLLLY